MTLQKSGRSFCALLDSCFQSSDFLGELNLIAAATQTDTEKLKFPPLHFPFLSLVKCILPIVVFTISFLNCANQTLILIRLLQLVSNAHFGDGFHLSVGDPLPLPE